MLKILFYRCLVDSLYKLIYSLSLLPRLISGRSSSSFDKLFSVGFLELPSIDPDVIDLFVDQTNTKYPPKYNEYGMSTYQIMLRDINFLNYIFTSSLHSILSEYLPSRFWLRNSPAFRIDNSNFRRKDHPQHLYHLDGALFQMSIIVLLEDLTVDSYHTSFIPSPFSFHFFNLLRRDSKSTKTLVRNLMRAHPPVPFVGKKGSVFLFNAGNNYHCGVPGCHRSVLHFNVSVNSSYANYSSKVVSQIYPPDKKEIDRLSLQSTPFHDCFF